MSKELNKATVEQAGGDERDFQAEGAQEVPSPVSQEYDRHLISLLRKGEALPGHQEEAADEIERLRDWNDHLNNTVLPNILNPNFLMLMKGGERLLDLCTKDGKFIGVSLNDMKDVFDWMVTHARIAPDHAALAQPSPAQAEAERPEVVARVDGTDEDWFIQPEDETELHSEGLLFAGCELGRMIDFDQIVGALRADRDSWAEQAEQRLADWDEMRKERDAALVEVERLRESKGDPVGSLEKCMKVMYERDEHAKRLEVALARVAELEGKLTDWVHEGFRLNEALAVAQAQHSVPEISGIGRDAEHPRAVVLYLRNEPSDEDMRAIQNFLRAMPADVSAKAQHSVPEGVTIERDVAGTIHIKVGDFDFIQLQYQRPYTDNASTWKLAERIASLLAAAPGKEVGHE
ncbi:hypothetical protein ACV344_33565 [Pseudomonas aeruginosa]|uniref:hypothetical protein n=1 Tax=Pseudomonas aeruginosa TaxID=287 RepID=UPI001C0F0A52|nr:hypothetical protein [Pseudomonas aeruginosa]MBX6789443.1 hypothetical protein [Pseudomonas aeruginosa]HBO5046950.1 hypothetical protein [Pseudomonas aeruginosa]